MQQLHRYVQSLCIMIITSACISVARPCVDGTLNVKFGKPASAVPGYVFTTFTGASNCTGLLSLANGTIIATGYANSGLDTNNFAAALYTSNGTQLLTNTLAFGTNSNDTAYACALRNECNSARCTFVMAGSSNVLSPTGSDVALASLNCTDLSLDTHFNPNGNPNHMLRPGTVVTQIPGLSESQAYAVAVQPNDGKIVAVGFGFNADNVSTAIVIRYNPDGSLDNTFNNTGIKTFNFSDPLLGVGDSQLYAIAISKIDGLIYVAGTASFSASGKFAIASFNPNGSFNKNFNGTGMALTTFPSLLAGHKSFSQANALALLDYGTCDTNQRIIAVGYTRPTGSLGTIYSIALASYTPLGSLDCQFGNKGKVITPIYDTTGRPLNAHATAALIEINCREIRKILVAGWSGFNASNSFTAVRYDTRGKLDKSFGMNGISISNGGGNELGNALTLVNDNGFVIGGVSNDLNSHSFDFTLAGYILCPCTPCKPCAPLCIPCSTHTPCFAYSPALVPSFTPCNRY